MTEIVEIVQTVGFPIAVSIYLLWQSHNVQKNVAEKIAENTAVIKEALDAIRQAPPG